MNLIIIKENRNVSANFLAFFSPNGVNKIAVITVIMRRYMKKHST